MKLPSDLLHIFAQTRLYTDGQEYVMVSVPLKDLDDGITLLAECLEPFSAVIVDKDELTLVLAGEVWEALQEDLPASQEAFGYRLISFDLPMDLGLVGYIATLTGVLAEVGVSLLVFSAYQRDHFLVPEADFDRAWEALDAFIDACQREEERGG